MDDIDEITLDFRSALRGTVQATTGITPVGTGSKGAQAPAGGNGATPSAGLII